VRPFLTASISGSQGTSFVVEASDAQRDNDYAVYGIASDEQIDQLCYVKVLSKNINDSNEQQDLTREFLRHEPQQQRNVGYIW